MTLKDNSDDILIEVFGELVGKAKEQSTLILADFKVSKCMTTNVLQSTNVNISESRK